MTAEATPQRAERAAREPVRGMRRARAANAKTDASRRAAVIREELARPRANECGRPIAPDSTLRDLLRSASDAPPVVGSVRLSTRSAGG
jgi:hypothetical protein